MKKLLPTPQEWQAEINEVVDTLYKEIDKIDKIGKQEFTHIIHLVAQEAARRRGLTEAEVLGKFQNVVEHLPEILKNIPDERRSWGMIVSVLYIQFHFELKLISRAGLMKLGGFSF